MRTLIELRAAPFSSKNFPENFAVDSFSALTFLQAAGGLGAFVLFLLACPCASVLSFASNFLFFFFFGGGAFGFLPLPFKTFIGAIVSFGILDAAKAFFQYTITQTFSPPHNFECFVDNLTNGRWCFRRVWACRFWVSKVRYLLQPPLAFVF